MHSICSTRAESGHDADRSLGLQGNFACDLCGWPHQRLIQRFGVWCLVACTQCGLRWGQPKPDSATITKIYSGGYFNSQDARKLGYTDYKREKPLKERTFERRFRQIEALLPVGRYLDVGCAFGFS